MNSVEEKGNSNPYLLMIDAKCHTVSFPKPLVNATVQPFTVNNSSNVLFKVYTGADVYILCKPTYVNTFQDAKIIGLDKSAIVLTAYGGTDIEVLGSVTAKITVRGNTSSVKFIITDTLSPNILSYKDSMKLQLVQCINGLNVLDKTVIIDKYLHVFCDDLGDDLGDDPGEYTIQLKPNAKPVQQPPRPVPVHLKNSYKSELDNLEQQGVIRKVTQYTAWVNGIVLIKRKNNTIRVCLDPRQLNKKIVTSKHFMRRLDDILPEITNVKYFTVVDTKNGYWHISLSEENQFFTTFNTPWGKYCFKRLPFGLTCSGDAFQQQLDQVLSGISGVTGISDDILIWGDTAEQHDTTLHELLTRCQNVGIRLNREKIQYKQNHSEILWPYTHKQRTTSRSIKD